MAYIVKGPHHYDNTKPIAEHLHASESGTASRVKQGQLRDSENDRYRAVARAGIYSLEGTGRASATYSSWVN